MSIPSLRVLPSVKGFAPKVRTSLQLVSTTAKTQANLDAASVFALEYAQAVLSAAGGLAVPASGVMRRALAVYVRHLEAQEGLGEDVVPGGRAPLADEFQAVSRACKSLPLSPQDHQEAAGRFAQALASLVPGARAPAFSPLLRGPRAMDMEALTARAEEAAYQAVRAFRAFRKPSKKQEAAAAPQLHSPGYPASSAPGDVQAPPAAVAGPSVAPWD